MPANNGKPSDSCPLRSDIWRKVNQCLLKDKHSTEEQEALFELAEDYSKDLRHSHDATTKRLSYDDCGVCGLLCEQIEYLYHVNDDMFDPLRSNPHDYNSNWPRYGKDDNNHVCRPCLNDLRTRHRIPRFSRANVPLPNKVSVRDRLSEFEQMLISPILPMIYLWRYRGHGQYQSKRQCITFRNNVHQIASFIPHHPSSVIVNLSAIYGSNQIEVNVSYVREAPVFLTQVTLALKP